MCSRLRAKAQTGVTRLGRCTLVSMLSCSVGPALRHICRLGSELCWGWVAVPCKTALVTEQDTTSAPGATVVLHIEPLFTDNEMWLEIEVPTTFTLAALHEALNTACEFEAEGAYAFYMNNRFQDRVYNYEGHTGRATGKVASTTLASLNLPMHKRFAYIADVDQDFRCEITVVSFGERRPDVEYPNVTASQLDDEDELEGAELPPAERAKLDALAGRIRAVLSTKKPKPTPGKGPRSPKAEPRKELESEATLAMDILDLVDDLGVAQVFGYLSDACRIDDQRVQSWLATLDERLGEAELFLQAAALDERLAVAFRAPEILPQVPRWLLWAGKEEEANKRLQELLLQYPQDATMLYYAGLFYLDADDTENAERCLYQALNWTGSDVEEREQILTPLSELLVETGRAEEAEKLRGGAKKNKPRK